MGDFSRDPRDRLLDSVGKHYVGVRLQQGVPILDADWNESEDLRRHELETVGSWLLGDGVPSGSDGFRISAIAGGGVGTVVLTAASLDAQGSTVAVDEASTAAAALGFDGENSIATRSGTSPARLTGNRAEPFPLSDGQTLVVRTNDGPSETVTFVAGDFTDISAATAAEVVAAITDAVSGTSASTGEGNDFLIRGGPGADPRSGALLVEGRFALNPSDLKYTEQPLYLNDALADAWGVEPVPPLTTPSANTLYVVYLDVWDREVDQTEDSALVDPRVGVETTVRIRREWAVRVVDAVEAEDALSDPPEGHSYYALAELARTTDDAVTGAMITDLRDTDISVRRGIAYRSSDGQILVSSAGFRNMLVSLRNNVRDFIDFLTVTFVDPGEPFLAGEVAGIGSLSAVAELADHGISLLDAQVMGTRAAFDFFEQLLVAEERFVTVWREGVLPIVKPAGPVYAQSFEGMVDAIESFLTGPAPPGFTSVQTSLEGRNLMEARRSQDQINNEFGEEVGRPTGILSVTYLGSPAATIQGDVPFDMEYEVSGSVTPEDDLDVEVTIDEDWQTTARNEDGSLPFSLVFGPGADTGRFLLTVRPPDVATAETQINLRVSARQNSGALYHVTAPKTLRIGDPPPPSEEDYAVTFVSSVAMVGGEFQVPTNGMAIITFRLWNNTGDELTADLEFEPSTDPLWQIQQGSFGLEDQVVEAEGMREFSFRFTAPSAPDNALDFEFRARDSDTGEVVAETQITLTSV